MKARVYFIVSSIITFLLSVYSIIISKDIVKATLESFRQTSEMFSESFSNRIIDMYEKSGVAITILFALIVVICSIVIFVLAKKKALVRHKGLVIGLSIMTFFSAEILLVQLLAIANFIVILCCKRKNPEDFKNKEKKEIPKLKLDKCSMKDYILSIILVLVYFSQFIWLKYLPTDYNIKLVFQINFNILMIFLSLLVFYNQITANFKIFKTNFGAYMKLIIPKIGITYLFLFVASLISTLSTNNAVSANQETLESLPLYFVIPAAVIYAPIVEELIFRGVIRRFIKKNIIFIIISALSFGLLHTIGEASLKEVLLMSLPYVTLGAYLSHIYVKTNNIFSSIISHMIFNAISSIFMLFL